jgi:hypothetical protein
MKKFYFVLVLLGLFQSATFSQIIMREQERRGAQVDTVYVNDNTSYLLFDHDIYAFSIGNENDFAGIAYKNSFQVRARTRRPGTVSSAFVTFGDSTVTQYRYVILRYDPYRMNEFYDFRSDFYKYKVSELQREQEKKLLEEEKENFFTSQLRTRARNILSMPNEMDLGNTLNNLSLICRLIRIDNEYAYMKFEFINNSAVNYNFEKVSFQYEEKYKQGFLKRKKLRLIDVFPVIQPDYLTIPAYDNYEIVYVIPIYGLRDSETMVVTFRENMGGRNIDLRIDSDVVAKSRLLFE